MEWQEGDLAEVFTASGKSFVAKYTLARGIDYFWCPVGDVKTSYLSDPVVEANRL